MPNDNKKSIAEKYNEQYSEILNKLSQKVFKGDLTISYNLLKWYKTISDNNIDDYIKLIIGNLNDINNMKTYNNVMFYRYDILINNNIKHIHYCDIDDFKE